MALSSQVVPMSSNGDSDPSAGNSQRDLDWLDFAALAGYFVLGMAVFPDIIEQPHSKITAMVVGAGVSFVFALLCLVLLWNIPDLVKGDAPDAE